MKTISRTIERTTIEAEAIKFVDGEWKHRQLPNAILIGNSDKLEKESEKFFNNHLQEGETLAIKLKKTEEKVFSVPVDKFIELAESLEVKQEETEIKEEVIRA